MFLGKITGLSDLINGFKKLMAEAKKQDGIEVQVGYTAAYAVYVHENIKMVLKGKPRPKKRGRGRGFYWDPQGKAQAKFLEEPARILLPELKRVVEEVTKATGSLEKGMLAAGFRLQRESQIRVPVDKGILKNSAFTRLVKK
jgi:hypothetical protein